mgnify:CR=1 FL=1
MLPTAGEPRFQLSDARLERLEPSARALQHFALGIELVTPGEIELGEIGAQHGAEVVLQILPQVRHARRQALQQTAQQIFNT